MAVGQEAGEGAPDRRRRQTVNGAHPVREIPEEITLYDDLTGLPNRTLLRECLQQAIQAADRDGSRVTLLILDLDRFKEVNDTLGHQNGDLLLREVGQRLQGMTSAVDTVARLGGDEFAILLPGTDAEDAALAADSVLGVLTEPFLIDALALVTEASVGIAVYPDHGPEADALFRCADVAMYAAKRRGGSCALYSPDQDTYRPERLALIGEVRNAIERDELVVHYQPTVDLRSGRVSGVEALVRCHHPDRGLVPPDEFIPLVEQTALIRPLSLRVLESALAQHVRWWREGLKLDIAVNLSARNLLDPRLVGDVRDALERWQVPAAKLSLEITESAMVTDLDRAVDALASLRALGVRVSIDDFGTGYSSLTHLRRLRIDEIKIDRSFVMGMGTEASNDTAIVRSMVELGHDLDLHVVAEGVEDRRVYDLLATIGCDTAQGFYIARPMPAEELTERLLAGGLALGAAGG